MILIVVLVLALGGWGYGYYNRPAPVGDVAAALRKKLDGWWNPK